MKISGGHHRARWQPPAPGFGGGRGHIGTKPAAIPLTRLWGIRFRCIGRLTEFLLKQCCRYRISKAPANIVAVVFIAPACWVERADASRFVPLVHGIQLWTKATERHPHFYDVRKVSFDCLRAGAAFVAGHWLTSSEHQHEDQEDDRQRGYHDA